MILMKRTWLLVGLLVIALVSVACGGGGTGSPQGDVAKAVVDATFSNDIQAIRNNVCAERNADFTPDQEQIIRQITDSLGTIDTSGVIYTYNEQTRIVMLSGVIKSTVNGVTTDLPITDYFSEMPVIEEGGSWKVCYRDESLSEPTPEPELSDTPEQVVENFLSGLLNGNMEVVRETVCERALAELTPEQSQAITDAASQFGDIDMSNVTYTFNPDTNTVSLSGTLGVSMQGTSAELPVDTMFGAGIPVVEEGGNWKACPDSL